MDTPAARQQGPDLELNHVAMVLATEENAEVRFSAVLRRTFDQIYDGQHTGRYRWDQLAKTEKTHFGTLVEINLQREFSFDDGTVLDFTIGGVEVDCKYSQSLGGWMIPPEALGHVCLLVTASDETSSWSAGLFRCNIDLLNLGGNRDQKRTLNSSGRAEILWLWQQSGFPPNALLELDDDATRRIFVELGGARLGQQRVNELFRLAEGKRLSRTAIATAAQQDDYMKRVRANGGARTALRAEGYVILGDYASHQGIAKRLCVAIPQAGESVSARVVPCERGEPGYVILDGAAWRLAQASEVANVPAPQLPAI